MESNLTPGYIQFVNEGQSLTTLVQNVIDRAQYLPGFLDDLNALLNKYEDPFEEIPIDPPEVPTNEQLEGRQIMTSPTGTILEKRLKPEYRKTSVCETL